jgi:hypothetical protein
LVAPSYRVGPDLLDEWIGMMLGDALKDLLKKKKQSGQKIEAPREREPSKVVNLMEVLRRSVETERAGGERRKPAPRTGDHRAPKKAGRLELRARRAGYASIWAPPEQGLGTRNGQAIIQSGPGVCPSCPRITTACLASTS